MLIVVLCWSKNPAPSAGGLVLVCFLGTEGISDEGPAHASLVFCTHGAKTEGEKRGERAARGRTTVASHV